ncbi:MAG: tetratricopeptide repeat protein [Candidatus Binatota bacterium]
MDLAESLRQQGRLGEALETVQDCLEEKPRQPRALLLRARLLYQEGRLPQAIESLRSLDFILGGDKAFSAMIAGMKQLRKARSSEPGPSFVTETMAQLLVEQGYHLEALDIYRRLYIGSEEKQRLWKEILLLRDRLEQEGSRAAPKERLVQELEALDRWMQGQQKGL